MKDQKVIKIDFILSLLKSNNQKLFHEIILAKKNKMWATVIVFSLAIIDNIFNDDYYEKMIDGLEINNLKFGKDILWLRNKRNGILHFDNLKGNSKIVLTDDDLKFNSEKAYRILLKTLTKLFPYYEK